MSHCKLNHLGVTHLSCPLQDYYKIKRQRNIDTNLFHLENKSVFFKVLHVVYSLYSKIKITPPKLTFDFYTNLLKPLTQLILK